ncbi:short-chain dehydrogenase/reductase family 16C member 6-like [Camponotus floridanus]|uniref:short-chain dehydrogenase/reductase family 16C member 6-like n=1 Tax=Camponotus floridanus TaxID=104421 RepID=UPI000DC66CA0|nr:short-chain dehydrogenase/reductase family 16C member 6-like [Camponotus floridanus]
MVHIAQAKHPIPVRRHSGSKTLAHFARELNKRYTLQAFLPSMIEKNHGRIVALLSLAAFLGATHGTVYCPTKTAIKVLMEAVSDELRIYSKGKSLIKFTTIYPAVVLTGLFKKPRTRYVYITKGLTPQDAASLIIDAQRQNVRERSIPSYWLLIIRLFR